VIGDEKLDAYFFWGRFNMTKPGASDRATTTSGHSSPFRSPAATP
jgi:hypothetical protein